MKQLVILTFALCAMLFSSCEKFEIDAKDNGGTNTKDGNLTVKAECVYTRAEGDDPEASLPLKDRFTLMSLVIYRDGVRVNYVNQKNDAPDFGTMTVDLDPGTYKLVVLAHSGTRSPTTTNINKISFSAPLTDVFSYCGEITVTAESSTINVKLTRAVAKVQLNITDEIPAEASMINFSFKGAALTLDAETQKGIVSSTRRNVEMEMVDGTSNYAIYTFVSDKDTQKLDMDVSVYKNTDSNPEVLASKSFENVPVEIRKVTNINKGMFDGILEGPSTITVEVDGTWEGTIDYTM